jgi:hypothetical protein
MKQNNPVYAPQLFGLIQSYSVLGTIREQNYNLKSLTD